MTDQTTPVTDSNPAAPIEDDGSFDAALDSFLNHRFDVDDNDVSSSDGTGQTPAGDSGTPGAQQPGESPPIAPPAATPSVAQADPNAAPPAGNPAEAAAPQAPDDSALLAHMLGLGDTPAPSAPAAPAAQTQPENEPTAYTPLPEIINVPENLAATIFNGDDPNTQRQALGALLGSFGNAILALADKRMSEHHVPQTVTRVQQVSAAQAEAERVKSDFYSAFPDLKNYGSLVAKAFKAIEAQTPNVAYSPEIRDRAGNLARSTLKQMGLGQPAPAAAPVNPAAPIAAKPITTIGFEAGGARPGGGGTVDKNSPGALLDELTQW